MILLNKVGNSARKSAILILSFYLTNIYSQGPVDDYCLNCICQEGCAITYNFWIDAGKPSIDGGHGAPDSAYAACYESYECSSRAIQNYMFRYQKDCNNDGKIDCSDHAAVHQHGADDCAGKETDKFQFQVYNCLNKKK